MTTGSRFDWYSLGNPFVLTIVRVVVVLALAAAPVFVETPAAPLGPPAVITIDYPAEGSIFPSEITAPTFLWHDEAETASLWSIDVAFADGSSGIHTTAPGVRAPIGEIDPRCVAETNELPHLTPYEETAHSWQPDAEIWTQIKNHSTERPAAVTITGFAGKDDSQALSRGKVPILTSMDPVGAPIFYRDVPLMPSELEKGVIKPLVPSAVPLIGWRLRNVAERKSLLLMEGLPTCANCHSFSLDGKTLAMDVDGPLNDKGTYAIARIAPQMSIRNEDVFSWNDFKDKPPGARTIGFMSQISPDGQYAVTTLNEAVYVANFKDYRFLQVFYPTRGIIASYSRATERIRALPGADDPSYVQTGAVWTPDGKYLVFARARAEDPYPEGRKVAEYANDPAEVPIRYDLCRIPFNAGRGGRPQPIAGASENGMSNTFPKVSADGRWIVFVKCRNGQLMRPDGELYIVPAEGGRARRMQCNTRLMNSWHSFSPNGRWLVFSSKSRTPYTQMFLTHLDKDGNDSPAILIDDATAANRAVNIPEFVNIPPDGLLKMDAPATEFYRIFDHAWQLAEDGRYEDSISEWRRALEISPGDAKAHNNLGRALAGKGDFDEAIGQWSRALELNPEYAEAHNNLGVALFQKGKLAEATVHFQEALKLNSDNAEVHNNLGRALDYKGRLDKAIEQWEKALEIKPAYAEAHNNLGTGLIRQGRVGEAISHWKKAAEANPKFAQPYFNLGNAFYSLGEYSEALAYWQQGLRTEPNDFAAMNHIAWVLATCPEQAVRNGIEAVRLAEQTVRLAGTKDPSVLDTLAAAYAEVGRFFEATRTATRAMTLALQQNKRALASAIKDRMVLYASLSPFRETQNPRPSRSPRP